MKYLKRVLYKTMVCCLLFIFSAHINVKSNNPEKVTREKQDVELSELVADKVNIHKTIQVVDSLTLQELLDEESLLYPADDLYTIWDNRFVNPYDREKISIPDSFTIDVSSFVMPFEGRVTSKYGPRKRRMHYGTDIKVQVGDTIKAAFDGKIRIRLYEKRGYGYYLVVRHNNGLETVYGHLSKFLVELNDEVKAGQPIALGGNTGRSTGSHLHFEARFMGQPINPEDIFDFENFVAHNDYYTFNKKKSGSVASKYTTGGITYHRIKSGDTLGKIARQYGITINQLCKLNNIKTTTTLRVGRSLRCS